MIKNLAAQNIEFEGKTIKEVPTGIAIIAVCNRDNFIILDGGANEKVTYEMLEEKKEIFQWTDFVVFQFEIPIDVFYTVPSLQKNVIDVQLLRLIKNLTDLANIILIFAYIQMVAL